MTVTTDHSVRMGSEVSPKVTFLHVSDQNRLPLEVLEPLLWACIPLVRRCFATYPPSGDRLIWFGLCCMFCINERTNSKFRRFLGSDFLPIFRIPCWWLQAKCYVTRRSIPPTWIFTIFIKPLPERGSTSVSGATCACRFSAPPPDVGCLSLRLRHQSHRHESHLLKILFVSCHSLVF